MKPKRGRPEKKPEDRRSYQLSVRLDPNLRAALEKSAAERGRKMSSEIEDRLKASFDDPHQSDFISPNATPTRNFLLLVEFTLRSLMKRTGAPWSTDRFTFDNARSAINYLLDRIRPSGDADIPETMLGSTELKGKRLQELKNIIVNTDWGVIVAEQAAMWILDDDAAEQRAMARAAMGRGLAIVGDAKGMRVEAGHHPGAEQKQYLKQLDQIAKWVKPKPQNKPKKSGEPPEYEP